MEVAWPRWDLLPLLPVNWQMDVPCLGFNHEKQDNTQGLPYLPILLTSDPMSSLTHGILCCSILAFTVTWY